MIEILQEEMEKLLIEISAESERRILFRTLIEDSKGGRQRLTAAFRDNVNARQELNRHQMFLEDRWSEVCLVFYFL